jgi:solute:Na+ symporter, SSS family
MDFNLLLFKTNFTLLDWVIVFIYIALITCIGIYVNRYVKNTADFMVGGRSVGLALNTASYIGTELGLVTIMYASIEGFNRGFSYLIIPLISFVAAFILGKTGFVISRLRELKLTTIPEFFEKRFDKSVRVVAAILLAFAGILNMGLFPKMGATFIAYSTGLASLENPTLVVNIVMSILIVLVVVYTVMSGMVAVIICDYIQFVVLSIGLLIGLYFTFSLDSLGWNNIVASLVQNRGEAVFNPFHAESYGYAYSIWMFVIFFAVGFAWGPTVSRVLTAKDPITSRRTFLLGAPGQFIRLAIPAMFAFAAFTYFIQDENFASYFFADGIVNTTNSPKAMPLLLGKIIPTGLIGVLVAGLLAAFMSTHDSYFVAWASVISRDIVCQFKKGVISDQQEIRYARITIVIIGLFLLIWGLWYKLPDSVWTYMAITGNIYMTGATATLIGGVYWKRTSKVGALAALFGGLFSIIGVVPSVINTIPMGILGLGNYILCGLLLIVFSLLFPDKKVRKIS